MDPNAAYDPNTRAATCVGTLLVVALHISQAELLKTVVLAALGASVSFAVSVLLRRTLRRWLK